MRLCLLFAGIIEALAFLINDRTLRSIEALVLNRSISRVSTELAEPPPDEYKIEPPKARRPDVEFVLVWIPIMITVALIGVIFVYSSPSKMGFLMALAVSLFVISIVTAVCFVVFAVLILIRSRIVGWIETLRNQVIMRSATPNILDYVWCALTGLAIAIGAACLVFFE